MLQEQEQKNVYLGIFSFAKHVAKDIFARNVEAI